MRCQSAHDRLSRSEATAPAGRDCNSRKGAPSPVGSPTDLSSGRGEAAMNSTPSQSSPRLAAASRAAAAARRVHPSLAAQPASACELSSANRRGYWSFWIFLVLFVLSLFAEFIANDRPIVASYKGESLFPVFVDYPEEKFGGFLAPHRLPRPGDPKEIEANGWMLWPPIRFSYRTHNLDLPVPAPAPPTWMLTDEQVPPHRRSAPAARAAATSNGTGSAPTTRAATWSRASSTASASRCCSA